MNKGNKITFLVLIGVTLLGYFIGFKGIIRKDEQTISPIIQEALPQLPQLVSTPKPDTRTTFFAVGDNLIHDVIYQQAKSRATDGGYNFDFAYENIIPVIPQDAVKFINQETVLASKKFPLSNYPMFNSPIEVGDKIVSMGFDVINHANNHMFDKWEKGLVATMDYWDTQPITFMGAWRNKEQMNIPKIISKNGIDIGLIGIAEHTNGISLPQSAQVEHILTTDIESIKNQVMLAKQNSDFVIVSVHWGNENVFSVTEQQKTLAQSLTDMGVDLVLGHHSHTVAPLEWIEGNDGKKTLVVYSLGNFISAMASKQNMLGASLQLDIVKEGQTGNVRIENAKISGIVTHYNYRYQNLQIYPLSDYTDELAKKHGVKGGLTKGYLTQIFEDVIPVEFR